MRTRMSTLKPDSVNFTVKRGITFTRTLRYKGPSGIPINLTSCSVVMEIREKPYHGSELLHTVNITISSPATDGVMVIVIDADESSAFVWNEGFYDVVLTDSLNATRVLFSGRLVVTQAISV
jgi:hypothetical protein